MLAEAWDGLFPDARAPVKCYWTGASTSERYRQQNLYVQTTNPFTHVETNLEQHSKQFEAGATSNPERQIHLPEIWHYCLAYLLHAKNKLDCKQEHHKRVKLSLMSVH